MRCARALPIHPLMPAASSLEVPVATALLGGLPGKIERPHPLGSPQVGHPINHHVAGPSSVDPDKAGRRHAQRGHLSVHERSQMAWTTTSLRRPRPANSTADPRRSRGRSSSLRCGRSTSTPTAVHRH